MTGRGAPRPTVAQLEARRERAAWAAREACEGLTLLALLAVAVAAMFAFDDLVRWWSM
ncbi:hypothetical protein HLV35_07405 [Eggerthellaceae bacterium zg-997]|nr:hypothetical protein [Eggerthellaceae bacterium zg-997]